MTGISTVKILYRGCLHEYGTRSQGTIYQKGVRYLDLSSPRVRKTWYIPPIANLANLTGGFSRPKYVFTMYGIYMPDRIAVRSRNKLSDSHTSIAL